MIFDDSRTIALFLDFDGTLVDFAATPEGVKVSDALIRLLTELNLQLNGALALISGRALASLAAQVPLPLSMAGSHGSEWRLANGPAQALAIDSAAFNQIKPKLLKFAHNHRLIAEDKGDAVALHYRQTPEKQPLLDNFLSYELGLLTRGDVRVIAGNCVREIQPAGVDKGVAIDRFMDMVPFAGCQPVYIGDDTTDEDGFAWVNAHGGVSIKVGDGETYASLRLANTGEVFAFLQQQLDRLRQLDE